VCVFACLCVCACVCVCVTDAFGGCVYGYRTLQYTATQRNAPHADWLERQDLDNVNGAFGTNRKLYVSFAEYCLFHKALLQKRPII